MATTKSAPGWSDVKTKLADFDRAGLIGLVQDLYAASKDNQAFLHARFALGGDVLKPYKAVNVESLPGFTPPTRQRWESIPTEICKRLLFNVWCGHCRHETTITHFSGTIKRGDLLL